MKYNEKSNKKYFWTWDEYGWPSQKEEIVPNTMIKLRKNEYVVLPILDKICKTLGTDYGVCSRLQWTRGDRIRHVNKKNGLDGYI